jgi:hypothetical protein
VGEVFFFFVFFCFVSFLLRPAREAAKIGQMFFNEAMGKRLSGTNGESFVLFERAAAKGHEESIWITSVVKDVDMEEKALKEAFAKTEKPLGYYFAGMLSDGGREPYEFDKKSAEGGCSWGQVGYGLFFWNGWYVEEDEKVYVEWLGKAANQNNPWAMWSLGVWFRRGGKDEEKAMSYYRVASELGWKNSMSFLAGRLKDGEGCAKDLRQAVIWSAKGDERCWTLLEAVQLDMEFEETSEDSNQLCYAMGWGLYWYQYGNEFWNLQMDVIKSFSDDCLDYYCSCVELQQKSIFTFLLCWNRSTGIKGPGQMIAQMLWEGRDANLVQTMKGRREQETKRIKK